MKATIYTVPQRHILVLTNDDGRVEAISYHPTDTRAVQGAQDAGVGQVKYVAGIDTLFVPRQKVR
jgi:hypothetical protein